MEYLMAKVLHFNTLMIHEIIIHIIFVYKSFN